MQRLLANTASLLRRHAHDHASGNNRLLGRVGHGNVIPLWAFGLNY